MCRTAVCVKHSVNATRKYCRLQRLPLFAYGARTREGFALASALVPARWASLPFGFEPSLTALSAPRSPMQTAY